MQVLIHLRRWILRIPLILSSLLLTGGPSLFAQTTISKEYQIKAVFLFNFAQFVQWPPTVFTREDEPFRIGILGEDPFGSFLDETVQGEKIDGHPLVVERYGSIAAAKGCQILFIGKAEMGQIESIFEDLKGQNILTVGDAEGFVQKGGVVRFATEKNKIHLRISLQAAKRANLTISSKILRLSEIVEPRGN